MKSFIAAALAVGLVCFLAGDLRSQGKKAEGTVESIDFLANTVGIKLPGGETVEIIVGKETEIFLEKEKTTLDTIEYGENIWASYKTVDGKNEAVKVIITPPVDEEKSKMPPQIM